VHPEDGSGPVSMVFGVAIFLGFLLLATQVFVHLYATSTGTTAAFDTARRAAAEGGGGCADAPARARSLLGDYGRRPEVSVTCSDDGEHVAVTITGPTPAQLVEAFGRRLFTGGIERTAVARVEQFR
jgi:hypothetical protein